MVLFALWLVTHQCIQIIEKFNSVGAEAHKVGKPVSLWPNIDPYFPMFSVHLRRYYKNMYITGLSCIVTYFYFLKGQSKTSSKIIAKFY